MSFSEYTGSKIKVSHTVTRILRNAQENLQIQAAQGNAVGALLKSFSGGGNRTGSERLNKPSSPQSSKFGFQKLRLGLDKKRNCVGHHAELLDNQDSADGQDSGDEEAEAELSHHFGTAQFSNNAALIGPPKSAGSSANHRQKRWPF